MRNPNLRLDDLVTRGQKGREEHPLTVHRRSLGTTGRAGTDFRSAAKQARAEACGPVQFSRSPLPPCLPF